MRIGIDVGGTFTDVILVDEHNSTFQYAKTPTTHHDLAEGVLKGLEEILEISGESVENIDYLIHGTTIGTNAIVEGKGAKVGLITTKGFEDVLEIRRVARPKEAAFDFEVDNPPPLVSRYLRKGVIERINSKGQVVIPLDEESVREVVGFFEQEGVDSIVVSLLSSYLNPIHEQKVAEICRHALPHLQVSLSSEVCPEFREYERTCTTVMNGYLGPVIQRYLDNLVTRLNKRFGDVRLHIMQSNGGSMTVETAKKYASQLINSGPAGGAIATAFVSRITGNEMAVGADMGGTTFDISIIDKNLPRTTTWGGVTEYPIKLPMVDMKTIGAGGGSIAWVDQSGVLHVGPQSAGSDPGPACYNWGGVLPTVSDANCLLGRLNPNYFLGGKMVLQPELAHRAIHQHVADKMGVSVEEAALGIIRIVNANMAKGISGNSVEKGYDLREFVLVTLGGAAALHAADLARELNIGEIIVPPMSGNFSAVGLVVADIQHDYVKTIATNQYDISPQHLLSEFKKLQDQGIGQLKEEKVKEEQIAIQWSGDLRYEGQSWELNTPIKPRERLAKEDIDQIVSSFHNLHQQVYSYCEPDEIVEFVNIRVTVKGMSSTLTLPQMDSNPVELNKALKEKRAVYFAGKGYRDTAVYERELLTADTIIPGPCIIEEPICTTLVPDDCRAQVDHFGDLIITFNQVK